MNKKLILRLTYWWGAVLDGLLAIEMIFSAILGSNYPLLGIGITLKDGLEYQYAISIAGIFMLMWTVLLIWADKKPIERKGILIILIFVILGLRITMLFGYIAKLISFSKLLFDTIMSFSYLTFIIFSLIITRNFENSI